MIYKLSVMRFRGYAPFSLSKTKPQYIDLTHCTRGVQ